MEADSWSRRRGLPETGSWNFDEEELWAGTGPADGRISLFLSLSALVQGGLGWAVLKAVVALVPSGSQGQGQRVPLQDIFSSPLRDKRRRQKRRPNPHVTWRPT